ncbi:MAG TPA: hypothetical protein VNS88_03985 [Nitrospiraceae bacterium]|nr:hypothetical protein [Nitrospiraceae bacterium]
MNAFKRGTLQLSRTGVSHGPTTRITVYHEILRQIDEPTQGLQIASLQTGIPMTRTAHRRYANRTQTPFAKSVPATCPQPHVDGKATLRHNRLMLAMALTVGLAVFQPAEASHAAMERVPVVLIGPGCDTHENELSRALLTLQGVNAAHFHRIADHVLVDITVGIIVPEELVHHLNTAATSWQCRAEIMQSCITADLAPHTRINAP